MNLLDAIGGRPAWMRDAACREHPEVDFFPQRGDIRSVRRAKEVCARCLVREECLAWGLRWDQSGNPLGIWGGLSGRQRRQLRDTAVTQEHENYCESPGTTEKAKHQVDEQISA